VPNYPEIISKVTTPLALGALLLLLIFAVLNAAAKSLPRSLWTQLIRYGFILTIVAVILADVAYIAADFTRNEMLFRGTVTDENGTPIGSALIDVVGVSRGISDDTGHFLVAIPRHSSRNKYAVTFSAAGYKSLTDQNVSGPNPEPTAVTLQAIALSGDTLLNVPDFKLPIL